MRHIRKTEEVEHALASFIFANTERVSFMDITFFEGSDKIQIDTSCDNSDPDHWMTTEEGAKLFQAILDTFIPQGTRFVLTYQSKDARNRQTLSQVQPEATDYTATFTVRI